MPFEPQTQDSWQRLDFRIGRDAPSAPVAEARPATPAFMHRRRHDLLEQTIRHDVVPRLVLARGVAANLERPIKPAPIAVEVDALLDIVMQSSLTEAVAYVGAIETRGVPLESIFLDLLTPVARRLGTLWDEDLADFVEVTLGLGRLQQVLTGLSAPFQDDPRRLARKPRILLVPAPGDSHSFGMSMVAAFFQRAGWSGWTGVPETKDTLVKMVQNDHFAIVGFSASCKSRLDALCAMIRAVRRASMNRELRIMVGGPLFAAEPELVALVGADATATDGRQAVLQAQNLLALVPSRA